MKAALNQLGQYREGIRGNYRSVAKDYKQWQADVDEFRQWTEYDTEELWQAFCNKDTTLKSFDATAKEIADRWASKLNSRWGDVTGRADRMISAADQLITNKSRMAPVLKRNIVATLASIQFVKDGDLQGSNNPKIRVWMEFGKDQHSSRQRSCSVSELTISSDYCKNPIRDGSDCRLDCLQIRGNDCEVVEIKPNNSEAVDEGQNQANAYRDGLINMGVRDRECSRGTLLRSRRAWTRASSRFRRPRSRRMIDASATRASSVQCEIHARRCRQEQWRQTQKICQVL